MKITIDGVNLKDLKVVPDERVGVEIAEIFIPCLTKVASA